MEASLIMANNEKEQNTAGWKKVNFKPDYEQE